MLSGSAFVEQLSAHLFWDVERADLDADIHDRFLICRIMERGSQADVCAAWGYYGKERIQKAVTEAPALGKRTISFFANQFALPKEAFRASARSSNWDQ